MYRTDQPTQTEPYQLTIPDCTVPINLHRLPYRPTATDCTVPINRHRLYRTGHKFYRISHMNCTVKAIQTPPNGPPWTLPYPSNSTTRYLTPKLTSVIVIWVMHGNATYFGRLALFFGAGWNLVPIYRPGVTSQQTVILILTSTVERINNICMEHFWCVQYSVI